MGRVKDGLVQLMDICHWYVNEYIHHHYISQMYCSAAMEPEEREAYLKKKKEEAKLKFREIMKQKHADAKKVWLSLSWILSNQFLPAQVLAVMVSVCVCWSVTRQ